MFCQQGEAPMRTKLKVLACLSGIVVPLFTTGSASAADETFAPIGAIPVPTMQACPSATLVCNPDGGFGSFDISFVDPFAGVYIVADRSNAAVDVVDIHNDLTVARQLTGCGLAPCPKASPNKFVGHGPSGHAGPNGVITANDQKEVWAGDGDSTLKVLDINTGLLKHNITLVDPITHKQGTARADELCEDPHNHLVLIANDKAPDTFISFVSTSSYSVVDAIKLDGNDTTHNAHGIKATNGIEQCQWNPRTGKFYINIPEVNGPGDDSSPGAVLVIDPVSRQVTQTFPIPHADCAGPAGMAVGPEPQILLGCSVGSIMINEENGDKIASFTFRSDELWYNFGDNQYFLAGDDLGVVDAASATPDAGAKTNTHSVAAEPFSNHVYVPVNNAAPLTNFCHSANAGISNAAGCILIYGATGKDDKCAERGAPVLAFDPDGPHFLRIEDCHRERDRDHDR
jgi:hypothetical protein